MITPRAWRAIGGPPPERRAAGAGSAAAVLAALVLAGCGGAADLTSGEATATPPRAAPAATTTTDGSTAAPGRASPLRIGADEAVAVLADQDVRVLDVRTPQEFAEGHLPGAVNIDLAADDFDARVSALPREGTYLVYCRSGNRSAVATASMAALGFTTLYDVDGGIQDWAAAGGEVVR